jgi:predicted glycosyltransferase
VRSLKIAEVITNAFPDARCVILAGNSCVERHLPTRTDVVRMPEIRKSKGGDYMLLPPSLAGSTPQPRCPSEAFTIRKKIIQSTIKQYDPDMFLVDSRPSGLNDELLEVLAQMSAWSECKTVLMLRDIVDEPKLVTTRWADQGIYKLIDEAYDKVVVFGNEWIFDAIESYQMSPFRAKVFYLGYIGSPGFSASGCHPSESSGGPKHILITVGGGFDGADIIQTVCEYISRTPQNQQLAFSVVLGNNSTLAISDLFERYVDLSRNTQVYGHVSALDSLICKADLVVSMCGYNTLIELIERGKKIIAIPRTHSGSEQIMRASLLSNVYDGMWVIPEKELTVERLKVSIDRALMAPSPTVQMEMSGARNLIAFLEQEVCR